MKARLPASLTVEQKKALSRNINEQIGDEVQRLNEDLCAMYLYVMHVHCGHGKKRLEADWQVFQPILDALIERYRMDETDRPWLCTRKLKEVGIDCKALCSGTKPFLNYTINK